MHFLRRNQHFLLVLAVLVLSSVMVVRQYLVNFSAHVERVEDFILLNAQGSAKPAERLYQVLIQELPGLSDKALVDDLQRTGMVVDTRTPQPDSLLWKYHVSVNNELKKRAQKRQARLLREVEQP